MRSDPPELAFERVYRANYDRVLAYALCRADRDQALDVTGETFLVAWRRFGELPDEPLPWLLGVARRVLAGQRRASGRQAALVTRLAAQPAQPAAADPADQVAADSHIATALGCSRATFAVRLHRARRRLERELALAVAKPATTTPSNAHIREVS